MNTHRVNVMFAASAGILGTIHPGAPWTDLPLAALLLGLCALSVHPALCIPLAFIGAQQLSAAQLTTPPTATLLGALIGALLPLAPCRARGPVITAFGVLALSLS